MQITRSCYYCSVFELSSRWSLFMRSASTVKEETDAQTRLTETIVDRLNNPSIILHTLVFLAVVQKRLQPSAKSRIQRFIRRAQRARQMQSSCPESLCPRVGTESDSEFMESGSNEADAREHLRQSVQEHQDARISGQCSS